jgi:DNA-binding MarR family transcriptional regulator
MATAAVYPADGVVCATIERRARDWRQSYGHDGDEHYAFFSSLRFLYGSSPRASAHLRSLVRAGLVRSRKLPKDYGTGYALTVEGYAAAWASLPACDKCLAPIERDRFVCCECRISELEHDARDAETSAEVWYQRVQEHRDRAEAIRDEIESLRARWRGPNGS